MKKYILVLVIVLSFGAGLILGKVLLVDSTRQAEALKPEESEHVDTKIIELQTKMQKLMDVDVEDYIRLKSDKEKYQKADELLGKMVLVFLADLGVHVSDSAKTFLNNSAQGIAHPVESHEEAKLEDTRPKELKFIPTANANIANTSVNSQAPARKTWVAHEKDLSKLGDEKDYKGFLDKVKVLDMLSEVKGAKSIQDKDLISQTINGHFRGQVNFFSNAPAWGMEIENDLHSDGSKPVGNVNIRLSKNGNIFSNNRGNGNIHEFKKFVESDNAILAEAGGDGEYCFQLYYINSQDILIGNYYHKINEGNFAREGTVTLSRY